MEFSRCIGLLFISCIFQMVLIKKAKKKIIKCLPIGLSAIAIAILLIFFRDGNEILLAIFPGVIIVGSLLGILWSRVKFKKE